MGRRVHAVGRRVQPVQVTIEELQQGLVALDLVPAAPNAALLELFRNCDRDGQGNIDYDVLCTKLQGFEAKGNAMFVPGYRGAGKHGGAIHCECDDGIMGETAMVAT